MTYYEKLSLIIQAMSLIMQAIGVFGVLVSVSFIWMQIRQVSDQLGQANEQTKSDARDNALGQMAGIDAIFVEHPEMYPYFYENKEIRTDDPKYHSILTVAMAVTNSLEATLPREGDPDMPWWHEYMIDQYALSPIMRDYLEFRKDWFDPRLYDFMKKGRAKQATESVADKEDDAL